MRLIEPKVEYLPQEEGLQGMYKQIEKAGRTCYQSQDKITEDSAKKFVDMLTKNGHGAMLEHGTVYLKIPVTRWAYLHYSGEDSEYDFDDYPTHQCNEKYSKMKIVGDYAYVTTNYRVIANSLDTYHDLSYLCEPTEYHEKRYTFRFTTNIGVSRELNRHRVNSMAEESSRVCGYYRGKFGSEITYILNEKYFTPTDIEQCKISWIHERPIDEMIGEEGAFRAMCEFIGNGQDHDKFTAIDYWLFAMFASEYSYMGLINQGWKPQDARCVLNLNTKTELVHTAFESDWKHFCELRCAKNAHPEAQFLANKIKDFLKYENQKNK